MIGSPFHETAVTFEKIVSLSRKKSAPALAPGNDPISTTPICSTNARNFQISSEHASPSNPASSDCSLQS
jgi:hypothetical protein